jgi:hypothetical protein
MAESLTYRFIQDIEPTDEQLHNLMKEVAADVKKKAEDSDRLFYENMTILVDQIVKKFKDKSSSIQV